MTEEKDTTNIKVYFPDGPNINRLTEDGRKYIEQVRELISTCACSICSKSPPCTTVIMEVLGTTADGQVRSTVCGVCPNCAKGLTESEVAQKYLKAKGK